jgi:ATP-binding cassette subfamily B multidrug efflux pump
MKELKHLNKYFKKYRFKLLVGILITVIARVFSLVMPPFINKSVQAVEGYLSGPLANVSEVKSLLLEYVIIIIGAALLAGFFTFLMRQTIINISRYVEQDLKNEIFDHYQKLHLAFYKNNRTGDLMNRISEDVSQVRMYVGPAIMYGIQTITLFACLIPLMFIKAPVLAAYTLLPLPFLSILIYKISKVIHKKSTAVQSFLSTLSTFTQERFSGISVIKAYCLENDTNKNLEILANEGRQKSLDLAKINAWFFPLMILMIGVSNLFVIYIGGRQYIDGEITSIGLILEFIIYVNMLTWPVAIVGWLTSIIQQADASQKRINEFLQTVPAIVDLSTEPLNIEGHIVFDQVCFTYPDTGIKALNNLSFEVKKGQTLAIIGKTGSGKSTILELISRMYDLDQGQLLIDGRSIEKVPLSGLRTAIGAVPQDAFLFSDTIKNNIAFGKENASLEAVESAAKKAMVHQNISEFSKGYETILGERGITLSGGQKQRVSIARALIKDPIIYLFDDCLSAVDTETEEAILKALKKSAINKTTIIVSHRVSAAKNADKILVLEAGTKIQEGTHQELIRKKGYYKELYESQSSVKEN